MPGGRVVGRKAYTRRMTGEGRSFKYLQRERQQECHWERVL